MPPSLPCPALLRSVDGRDSDIGARARRRDRGRECTPPRTCAHLHGMGMSSGVAVAVPPPCRLRAPPSIRVLRDPSHPWARVNAQLRAPLLLTFCPTGHGLPRPSHATPFRALRSTTPFHTVAQQTVVLCWAVNHRSAEVGSRSVYAGCQRVCAPLLGARSGADAAGTDKPREPAKSAPRTRPLRCVAHSRQI